MVECKNELAKRGVTVLAIANKGGIVRHVLAGSQKPLADLDFRIQIENPSNWKKVEEAVLAALSTISHLNGRRYPLKNRFCLPNQFALYTLPAEPHDIDLTIESNNQNPCVSSCDGLQIDLTEFLANRDVSPSFVTVGGYELNRAFSLSLDRKFFIQPQQVASVREGLRFYCRLLSSGYAPESIEYENEMSRRFLEENRGGDHLGKLQKYLEGHYKKDPAGKVIYLLNFSHLLFRQLHDDELGSCAHAVAALYGAVRLKRPELARAKADVEGVFALARLAAQSKKEAVDGSFVLLEVGPDDCLFTPANWPSGEGKISGALVRRVAALFPKTLECWRKKIEEARVNPLLRLLEEGLCPKEPIETANLLLHPRSSLDKIDPEKREVLKKRIETLLSQLIQGKNPQIVLSSQILQWTIAHHFYLDSSFLITFFKACQNIGSRMMAPRYYKSVLSIQQGDQALRDFANTVSNETDVARFIEVIEAQKKETYFAFLAAFCEDWLVRYPSLSKPIAACLKQAPVEILQSHLRNLCRHPDVASSYFQFFDETFFTQEMPLACLFLEGTPQRAKFYQKIEAKLEKADFIRAFWLLLASKRAPLELVRKGLVKMASLDSLDEEALLALDLLSKRVGSLAEPFLALAPLVEKARPSSVRTRLIGIMKGLSERQQGVEKKEEIPEDPFPAGQENNPLVILQRCEDALVETPGEESLWGDLMEATWMIGKLDEVLKIGEEALLYYHPRSLGIRKMMAHIYQEEIERFRKVEQVLRIPIREKREAQQKVLQIYQACIDLEPRNVAWRNNYGLMCLDLKRVDDAEKTFTEALKENPDDLPLRLNLISVYIEKKQWLRAAAISRQLIREYTQSGKDIAALFMHRGTLSLPLTTVANDRNQPTGERTLASRSLKLLIKKMGR